MSDFARNVSPPQLPFKVTPRLIISVVVAIVVIGGALSSFFVVDQTEQSVVTTFGKFNRVVTLRKRGCHYSGHRIQRR